MQQKVELVNIVPGGLSFIPVNGNTVPDLILNDQHTQVLELLAQGFDIEADQPVVDIHIGSVVESVQISVDIQLQAGCQTLSLRFGLLLDFPVQILQDRHILRLGISDIGTVDCPDSPVNQGLFHGRKTLPAAGGHLAEGQDEVGLQRQRVIILGVVQVDIHRIQVECLAASAAGGGKPDYLSTQTIYQGEILRFRVTDQDIVLGDQEHIQNLPLG